MEILKIFTINKHPNLPKSEKIKPKHILQVLRGEFKGEKKASNDSPGLYGLTPIIDIHDKTIDIHLNRSGNGDEDPHSHFLALRIPGDGKLSESSLLFRLEERKKEKPSWRSLQTAFLPSNRRVEPLTKRVIDTMLSIAVNPHLQLRSGEGGRLRLRVVREEEPVVLEWEDATAEEKQEALALLNQSEKGLQQKYTLSPLTPLLQQMSERAKADNVDISGEAKNEEKKREVLVERIKGYLLGDLQPQPEENTKTAVTLIILNKEKKQIGLGFKTSIDSEPTTFAISFPVSKGGLQNEDDTHSYVRDSDGLHRKVPLKHIDLDMFQRIEEAFSISRMDALHKLSEEIQLNVEEGGGKLTLISRSRLLELPDSLSVLQEAQASILGIPKSPLSGFIGSYWEQLMAYQQDIQSTPNIFDLNKMHTASYNKNRRTAQ